MTLLQEIRWHGRGGQGSMTASDLIAKAAVFEGKYVQSFPEFGPERMGAPLRAFTRVSKRPIKLHCAIYKPDVVVVLDPTLLKTIDVEEGLSEEGTLLLNTRESQIELRRRKNLVKYKLWGVPATDIAVKILGVGITNTAMLGALIRAGAIVKLASLERAIRDRFPQKIAEKNIEVMNQAYTEVKSI